MPVGVGSGLFGSGQVYVCEEYIGLISGLCRFVLDLVISYRLVTIK